MARDERFGAVTYTHLTVSEKKRGDRGLSPSRDRGFEKKKLTNGRVKPSQRRRKGTRVFVYDSPGEGGKAFTGMPFLPKTGVSRAASVKQSKPTRWARGRVSNLQR